MVPHRAEVGVAGQVGGVVIIALLACTEEADRALTEKHWPKSLDDSAVDSGETGETGETAETGTPSDRDLYVYTTQRYEADDTCLGAPAPAVDASCLGWQDVSGTVLDLGGGVPVPSAALEFWTDDEVSGPADTVAYGNASGSYSVALPVCQPMTTRVQGSDVVPTLFPHRALEWRSTGATTSEDYAIGPETLELAAEMVGTAPSPGSGSILAFVLDCGRSSVVNAQIFLHDGSGHAAAGMTIGYFRGGFPDPSAEATSADGTVAIFNIPPGTYVAEAWGWDGTDHVKLSQAPARVEADGLTISYLLVGSENGDAIPAVCFEDCSQID